MQVEVFDRTLTALQQRTPYRPFTVVLLNGTKFEVDYPGALVTRRGVAVFISPGGVPVIFDHEGVNQFVADLNPQPAE